ncbi:hypothetical protein RB195_000115 [Necator americanus]|uniref:Uncharacterized protein n=3 Tax=Necator americanus TaxID=51031 RepID=A0ABR1D7Z7_NECAM
MKSIVILFLLFTMESSAWSSPGPGSVNTTLSCACVLRDALMELNLKAAETSRSMTTTQSPTTIADVEGDDEETNKKFIPSKYWTLYKSNILRAKKNPGSYMDRFLALFRKRSTTPSPSFLVQEDSPLQSTITNFGKTMISKYLNKLKSQWNLLDRFVCSCDGDVLPVLNAKTYITMSLMHD